MTRPAILERLRGVQPAGSGWLAFCPAHDDRHKRSLSVGIGADGRTLLKCHAVSCPPERITAAVGMTMADLAPHADSNGRTRSRRLVASHDYTDESGALIYQVCRFNPKSFSCRRPDGTGGWIWNIDTVRVVPYRMDGLPEARRVYVVEGERDADTLAALGLTATCNHGGAGKWREEHTRALVEAAVPEVVVIPDNDPPGAAHAISVARFCAAAGIRVKVVRLPGLQAKGDVSDWLAAGHTPDELEALADEAPDFTAESEPPVAEPTVSRDGDAVVLTWQTEALVATASNFHDGHEGASTELLIAHEGVELHWARLALASTQARVTLARKLREQTREQTPSIDWTARLETICRISAEVLRAGEPTIALEPRVHDLAERYTLAPLQPRGQTSLMYAHGGGGKSLLALLAGILTATGRSLAELRPCVTGPVLLLDWESTREEHETRLALLTRGLGLDPGAVRERIHYRPMAGRLADDARRLRQDAQRLGIVSVYVDSVVPAAGPEAEGSEAAVRLMGVLRTLGSGVSRLLLGHVPKGEALQEGPTHPFGSVFYWNLSRSVWELRADDDDDHLRVSLTHKKVNAGPKYATFGLDFHFQPDRIGVSTLDLADEPKLTRSASQAERFLLALRSERLTTKAMAKILNATDAVAGAVGRRLHEHGRVVKISLPERAEDGSAFLWALPARRSDQEHDRRRGLPPNTEHP